MSAFAEAGGGQVSDHAPELLQVLDGLGLRPGAELTLLGADPFGGSFELRIGRRRRRISLEAAGFVRVRPRSQREGVQG